MAPRRRDAAAASPPGAGVIGVIRPSRVEGRLVCCVEDFVPFATPLPFKDGDDYLEPLGKIPPDKAGLHFREGVREISDETFRGFWPPPMRSILPPDVEPDARPRASSDTARRVDARRWNPRFNTFDLSIRRRGCGGCRRATRLRRSIEFQGAPPRYVEVKGTTRTLPHFFMSEGERLFSRPRRPVQPSHRPRDRSRSRDGATPSSRRRGRRRRSLAAPRHLGSALAERLS